MSDSKIPNIVDLEEKISDLLKKEGLTDSPYSDLLSFSLNKFKKQNLDEQYYGFHNVSHELIVTYNTLLASRGEEFKSIILKDDFKHLFAAALFHDYEPDKKQDKPHEILASNFVTTDNSLLHLFEKCGIDPNLVAVLILKTTYPWESQKSDIMKIISKHFSESIFANDPNKQKHYLYLGWFLSVTDRIGAYAYGEFLDSLGLAKKNAHSMGWNPEYLVKHAVAYFEQLISDEKEMTDKVLRSLPKEMRDRFVNNVLSFSKLREKEIQVRANVVYDKIPLIPHFEKEKDFDSEFQKRLFEIYDEIPDTLQFNKKTFFESLKDSKTILVTLRYGSESGMIVGFAKGGPLENYSLIRDISDENFGKSNTVFLEPLALEMGYWGHGGGPSMRKMFNEIAKNQGYSYLTSLQLRDVIQNRIDRHENIEFVQKLNPERLDYYRVTL
ncbi:MAG: hypothetical protein K5790_02110 [Nitrosopumilus sp.]|uniref:hypothetical protein n=1 Tax=Nitrosopumilus sp. TaxID=2024843 RepID=UPI00247DB1B7|nr:hypothetical protein [Nitrosopumilus sp.]MCV0392068.1 hypothetical protein [Nitrosopumilus sp.]